jgi:Family of unknown function (DUF5681)
MIFAIQFVSKGKEPIKMTETTKPQQRPAHLWEPGQSGNPAGRPKGSRNKLSEDFVAALYNDFQEHGSAAIAACRAEKPDVYVRIIAGLLPKDVHLKVQSLDELTDDQLLRKLAVLTEMAKPLLAKIVDPELAGPARAGAGAQSITDVEYTDIS